MGDSAQTPPHKHVSSSTDPCTRIHISVKQNIPVALEMVAGSKGAVMEQQPFPCRWRWIGCRVVFREVRLQPCIETEGRSADDGLRTMSEQGPEGVAAGSSDATQLLKIAAGQQPIPAVKINGPWRGVLQSVLQSIPPVLMVSLLRDTYVERVWVLHCIETHPTQTLTQSVIVHAGTKTH